MPKRSKGYISVRNCVSTKLYSANEVIEGFTKTHNVCSKCEGRTFLLNDSSVDIIPGITTVKWKGNEILESLNDSGNLNGDTVKKIIETVVHGRQQCDKCKGFGFVKQSRKKHESKKT